MTNRRADQICTVDVGNSDGVVDNGGGAILGVGERSAGREYRASLTGVTLITKFCVALTSTPPSTTPPSSRTRSVIVAVPLAFGAGVKVRLPFVPLTAGCVLKSALLVLPVISKVSTCADSHGAPLLKQSPSRRPFAGQNLR